MIKIDEKYYLEILKSVPGLHRFLIDHKILLEYKVSISYWIKRHYSEKSIILSSLKKSPHRALTEPLEWASSNEYLGINGFKRISWSKFHDLFTENYKNISKIPNISFDTIKII